MDKVFYFKNYTMRLLNKEYADRYYEDGFVTSDDEANYYTGTTETFTKDQIMNYIEKIVDDKSRYDFIILDQDEIVGEVVINNINQNNCDYRICIFKKKYFSKGIGYEATKKIIDFAFEDLKLESIELEVFPFNERGIALYKKLGFKITGEFYDQTAMEPYQKVMKMRLQR